MLERIRHMLIKEFIQIFRDPRMRTVIFLMPLLQTLVFGYAVTTDVVRIPTAIFDLDNSRASRELAARFTGSGYFEAVEYPDREEQVREFLDRGRVTEAAGGAVENGPLLRQQRQHDVSGGGERAGAFEYLVACLRLCKRGVCISHGQRQAAGKFRKIVGGM